MGKTRRSLLDADNLHTIGKDYGKMEIYKNYFTSSGNYTTSSMTKKSDLVSLLINVNYDKIKEELPSLTSISCYPYGLKTAFTIYSKSGVKHLTWDDIGFPVPDCVESRVNGFTLDFAESLDKTQMEIDYIPGKISPFSDSIPASTGGTNVSILPTEENEVSFKKDLVYRGVTVNKNVNISTSWEAKGVANDDDLTWGFGFVKKWVSPVVNTAKDISSEIVRVLPDAVNVATKTTTIAQKAIGDVQLGYSKGGYIGAALAGLDVAMDVPRMVSNDASDKAMLALIQCAQELHLEEEQVEFKDKKLTKEDYQELVGDMDLDDLEALFKNKQ